MKQMLTIIIVFSIFFFNHCSKKVKDSNDIPTQYIKINEQKVSNVHFTLKKRIEAPPIACPRIAVSPYQDKILVYGLSTEKEAEASLIARMYNKNFEFISEKLFLFGQGPGDASAFNLFSFSKDKIWISGNSNHRITIYNDNWNLYDIKNHRINADSFEIFENGSLFLTAEFRWDKKWEYFSFKLCSIPGFKIKNLFEIGPFTTRKKQKGIFGEVTEYSWFYRNKEIYILDCNKYRILKFDLSGKKLKDIQFVVDKIKTDHSQEEAYFTENGARNLAKDFEFADTVDPTASMIPLVKGFIVVRRHSYLTGCNGMMDGDYFTNDMVHMGKVKVPCFDSVFRIHGGRRSESFKYDNGFLYLVLGQEESDWIEKWEVHE
ncbi:MAG: hypothetical protein ACM3SY_19150 [Candidatus Omnitrophota bacterium]